MASNSAMSETEEGPIEEGVVEVISSTCWYVPGEINTVDTDFLIDTGSTYTIMDYELYKSIPIEKRPDLNPVRLILRSANREILQVHGQTHMSVTIGNEI